MFLRDKPVPREMVRQALELAIRAPSNSNVQPWHLHLVSGAARDRLVTAMLDEATSKAPRVPELPEQFEHLRRPAQLGVLPPTARRHRLHASRSA